LVSWVIALALLFDWAPATPVAIGGDSACPTPAQVAAELRALGGRPVAPGEMVRLDSDGDGLALTLRSPAGETVAQRRLARAGASCGDLAAAAAVVVASWLAEVPSTAPPLPPGTANRPASPNADGPAAAPSPMLAARAPARGVRYDAAALFVASLDPAFAAGGLVDVTLGPARSRWAAHLGLLGTTTRAQPIGTESADWTRAALFVGPRLRLARGAWLVDFDAGVALALLYARGSGFATDRVSYNVDPGLSGGIRAGARLGPVAPFIGVGVAGWLRRQQLDVDGGATASLPQWDLMLSAGVAIGAF
jgi:hypothetical protein